MSYYVVSSVQTPEGIQDIETEVVDDLEEAQDVMGEFMQNLHIDYEARLLELGDPYLAYLLQINPEDFMSLFKDLEDAGMPFEATPRHLLRIISDAPFHFITEIIPSEPEEFELEEEPVPMEEQPSMVPVSQLIWRDDPNYFIHPITGEILPIWGNEYYILIRDRIIDPSK